MIIYHGSTDLVQNPEIRKSETFLDFGSGFYTTTSYEQAERWAHIKMRRQNKSMGYVSIYEFNYDAALQQATVERFDDADMRWLQFVVGNRKGEGISTVVDMHIGPVADDNVYRSIHIHCGLCCDGSGNAQGDGQCHQKAQAKGGYPLKVFHNLNVPFKM